MMQYDSAKICIMSHLLSALWFLLAQTHVPKTFKDKSSTAEKIIKIW